MVMTVFLYLLRIGSRTFQAGATYRSGAGFLRLFLPAADADFEQITNW
jgi:hypothetical protein